MQDGASLPMLNTDQPLPKAEQGSDQPPENLPPAPSRVNREESFLPAVGAEQIVADKPAVQPIELNDQKQKEKTDTLFFNVPAVSEEHPMTAPDHESVSNPGVNASVEHQPRTDLFQYLYS